MTQNFYAMAVADVTPEIEGAATSVIFDVPPDLHETFSWQAGQHLTLCFTFEGKEERRSYTISNPPGSSLRIMVKRVKGGKVSNHIGDKLRVGDRVDVMPPFGNFALTPGATKRRTHYFFAAGSGITPMFAMIHTVLSREPHSVAHLIYGNTDAQRILFAEELAALVGPHRERFTLRHVLSAPSMWSWSSPWRSGRLDAALIGEAISETPPVAQDAHYWICGPDTMNGDVKSALMSLDVPASRIHMESLGGNVAIDSMPQSVPATALVSLDGATHEVSVSAGESILEASLKAGVQLPYSCQSGVCGACKARLSKGKVHMAARMALEDKDIANNEILTCQSFSLEKKLALTVGR